MTASQDLILEFVAAYNDKDAEGMAKLAHADIEWFYIAGSEVSGSTKGRAAMITELQGHFKSSQNVTSRLSDWAVNGAFVSMIETVSWTDKEGSAKSQASIAVYELQDDLIRRVWYYPEQKPN